MLGSVDPTQISIPHGWVQVSLQLPNDEYKTPLQNCIQLHFKVSTLDPNTGLTTTTMPFPVTMKFS
jgi:hypothetical protein